VSVAGGGYRTKARVVVVRDARTDAPWTVIAGDVLFVGRAHREIEALPLAADKSILTGLTTSLDTDSTTRAVAIGLTGITGGVVLDVEVMLLFTVVLLLFWPCFGDDTTDGEAQERRHGASNHCPA
jgi:hypothetical protein